jgi:hypothetical protein
MCISYNIIDNKGGEIIQRLTGEIIQRLAEECSSMHLKWPQLSVFDIIAFRHINMFIF